jgi:hypothetical protein
MRTNPDSIAKAVEVAMKGRSFWLKNPIRPKIFAFPYVKLMTPSKSLAYLRENSTPGNST